MKNFSLLIASSIILSILYETQAEILKESDGCKDIECNQNFHYQLELIQGLIAEETAKNDVANASKNAVVTDGTGVNINSLRMGFLLVGVTFLAIAMFANVNLYMSLASTPVDKATWAIMGFAFDVAKVMLLIISGVLWSYYRKPFVALFSFLFWIILTGVSLATLFGYTSKVTQESERQAAIESMGYKSAQSSLEDSENRLAAMAGIAAIDAGALQAKYDTLNQRKQAAEAELSGCPRNYLTKCVNPARAKLDGIQRELTPIANQLSQVQEYKGLQATKESAIESSRAALAGGASEDVFHPMFPGLAIVFNDLTGKNVTGTKIKSWFLVISAFLCELLASFLLLIVATIGGRNLHQVQGIQMNEAGNGIGHQGGTGIGIGIGAEAMAVPKQ